ncbi:MAG TPA: L,D-transpeptidase, partial [Longimicrobium sp.]|nr:L,D-transpeptidase [Longimicrobium sp.]
APRDADAQARRREVERPARVAERAPEPRASSSSQGLRVRSEALRRGGYAVVVDLDANRLYFAKGRRVLWSAPVGTGTGMRLENDRGGWDFDTPDGTFHVTYKAREPDWIAPDWYFIENKLPVPGRNSDARRFPRGLGAAAVYIGHGLAIHGTDRPELLGRRVSHGCIRLSNADALRLFHNVQVGTEVVIVGGENVAPDDSPPPPRTTSAGGTVNSRGQRVPPRDPFVVELEEQETVDLLVRLDEELADAAVNDNRSNWPRVASVLLFRGIKDEDDRALAGLLTRIHEVGSGTLRQEYATFLSDAFTQGPLRTLEVMGRLDRADRALVARAIVDATIGLYPRQPGEDASTPWPTKRAPREVLERSGQRAWDALRVAEQTLRNGSSVAATPSRARPDL